ncbi:hypothetical protein [Calothrix sp. 336/3]|nr:hypothetical protein [Calothrix sp. 336/3]
MKLFRGFCLVADSMLAIAYDGEEVSATKPGVWLRGATKLFIFG